MGGNQSAPAPQPARAAPPAADLTLIKVLTQGLSNLANSVQETKPPEILLPRESSKGLQVEKAYACGPGCRLDVDKTLTSSSLILSRDILGKLDTFDAGADSDEWTWDKTVKFVDGKPDQPDHNDNGGGTMTWNEDGSEAGRRGYGSGGWYRRANPDSWGKAVNCHHNNVDANGEQWMDNYDALRACFEEDKAAWKKSQDEHEKKMKAVGKTVYIWNPSDDNVVALNNETYGALTKLFIKPTIPFKLEFTDGINPLPQKLNVNLMSIFHPAPLRIETIQYDAVLQIGDFHGMSTPFCQTVDDESKEGERDLRRRQVLIDKQARKLFNELSAWFKKIEESTEMSGPMYELRLAWIGKNSSNPREKALSNARIDNDPFIKKYKEKTDKLEKQRAAEKLKQKRVCTPTDGTPDPVVIFIPLKINDNPSETQVRETKFLNTFCSKISNMLNQQPNRSSGYPDVPAITNNDWKLSDILDTDDCYYTWKEQISSSSASQTTQVTVIFMKNPVSVLTNDMAAIQRLPVTPPADVFHNEPKDVRFKSCLPKITDGPRAGQKVACPECQKEPPPLIPNPIAQMRAEQANDKSKSDGNLWISILLGMIGTIAIIVGAWFGIKFALGPGGELMKKLADKIGGATASAYSSIKKSAASLPSLPTSTPKFPRPPPPSSSPILPGAPARFLRRTRRRFANALGIGQRVGPQARRVTQSRGTAEGVGLDSALNAANPMSKNFFTPGKTRSPAEIADAAPANIPEPTGDFVMNNPGFKDKDAFIKAHRRTARHVPKPKTRPVDDTVAAPKPEGPAKKVIVGPSETPAEKIARLAKAKKALRPVKRRNIGPIEEPDTPKMGAPAMLAKKLSDRAKKARESVSDFDKAVENTPKKATIFDSPATRARLGIPEERSTEPQYLATASTVKKAGKGRRSNRFKTGRRV